MAYEEINSESFERDATANRFRLSPHKQWEIIELFNLQFQL